MADLTYQGNDEESHEIRALNQQVVRILLTFPISSSLLTRWPQREAPDEFENWEKLARAAESQEGGLNRNSHPQQIADTRAIYDGFLAKFPLLFGYWKKYADLEFSIAGTEAAELVSLAYTYPHFPSRLTAIDLRARCCKHHELGRFVDPLLLLQDGHMPRLPAHSRVSSCTR